MPSPLGRGLGAIIPSANPTPTVRPAPSTTLGAGSASAEVGDQVLHLELAKLQPNPHQARQSFDATNLNELVGSIREHGILVPLVVTPSSDGRYYIVAGERRFRAAAQAGLPTVPAIVRQASDLQRMELGLIENIQRQDLNAVELAHAYQKLIDEFSLTQEQIAQKVGKARPSVANTLRVLQLPTEVQQAIIDGKITLAHAKVLLAAPAAERKALFNKMLTEQLTVRASTMAGESSTIVHSHRRRKGKNPALAELEQQLQEKLGTKVRISASGNGGEIVVTYYDQAELGRISKTLLG